MFGPSALGFAMPSRSSRSRTALALVVLILALSVVPATEAAPISAAGVLSSGGSGALAPDRLPSRPDTGGPTTLRGQLLRVVAAAHAGTLPAALAATTGAYAGLLTTSTPGGEAVAVSLTLNGAAGSSALQALLARGGRVANRNGDIVEAYLPASALTALDSLDGIADASPILRPIPLGSVRQVSVPALGIGTLGQGVTIHGADQWQAAGVTGSGVKVGIIDGGFVGLTALIGRELPDTVHVRCYRDVGLFSSTMRSCESFTEHGTAVAETVSDMAPGASLYLADPLSEQDLLSTVAWMTTNGVRVINVSLGYAFEGPGDGTGPAGSVYSAVNAAVKGGALWVNAAGNAGEDGWVGPWADENGDNLLEFAPGDDGNGIKLAAGDSMIATLRWNDTWGRSANDYDLYLFGPSGTAPVAASEDPQTGRGDPVESFGFTASTSGTYRFVVRRDSGGPVSRIQLLVLTSADVALEHRTIENTLPSPADSNSAGAIAVGAVPFDDPSTIEPYSSQGPTVDGRIKPDLVAVDCTTTVTIDPFCGTSVSTPYVTGAAALVLASRPNLTPAALAEWLRSHAVPLGSPSPNNAYGFGRLSLGPAPVPPAPTSLTFTASPTVAVVGANLSPGVSVQVLDQDGQPITSGPGSTLSVTLAAAPASGAALSCPDGLTQAAVAGVATFAGCTIAAPVTGVTLTATASGVPPATSPAFDVLAAGQAPSPTITVAGSAAAIVWGTGVTIAAALTAAPGTPLAGPVGGRTVTFQASSDRAAWRTIGSGTTNDAGVATLAYRPVTNLWYRAIFAAAPDLGPATSDIVRVTVRQIALLRPTNHGTTTTVALGTSQTFTTLVRPARADVPPGTVVFEVYRLIGGRRTLVSSQRVVPDAGGTATLTVTFSSTGTWSIRSMASPTKVNANSVWTGFETYRVR
jgi:hypothetical protein